ncbi:MAG: cation:proton antiporter [Bacteroidota bacterium]
MMSDNITGLKLPLDNPVLVFALILFIILFSPILLNRLKIPSLIGLIIAGVIIGPHALNLMERDSSIILFGTVGLLYIMFLAGLETDINDFKMNINKSIVFGLLTFIMPMVLGTLSGLYILKFSLVTSVLLASMYASNTLITYPIVSKLGITKNRAVNISVGGTMITTVLALLVLAVVVGIYKGDFNNMFWVTMSISLAIFGLVVMLVFPVIARWFFKKFDDSISQYIFVLGMVFLGAFLAQLAGTEPIIGAFITGLALNRLIPRTSALMNRISFVGNSLFIPFFLIGVGMLIDFSIFFKNFDAIIVALVMTVIATLSKYLAALFTQKIYRFSTDERRIIFGLSNAHAASTLAAVLVGYNIILGHSADGAPIRLLNESILNGTILMIIVTCTIASFVTQKGAHNIAILQDTGLETYEKEEVEKILIPVGNPEHIEELVNLSVTIKSKNNSDGLFALNVINSASEDPGLETNGRKQLEKAVMAGAATDTYVHQLLRYDLNIANGITNVVKEQKITDIILGLHQKKGFTDTFLGAMTGVILAKNNATIFIYKSSQPLATVRRTIVVIPDKAEKEIGFKSWLFKVWNIGRNTGSKLVFYASEDTLKIIRNVNAKHPVEAEFKIFNEWDNILVLSKEIKKDDNLIIVLSRENRVSYHKNMDRIPIYLNKYFKETNYIIVYPIQYGIAEQTDFNFESPSLFETMNDNLGLFDKMGEKVIRLFGKRR